MSDLPDISNLTFDDIPEDRPIADGVYDFMIVGTKFARNDDGDELYLNLTLRPTKVVESETMKDEDLQNVFPVRHRLTIIGEERFRKMARDFFARHLKIETEGVPIPFLAEQLLNREVRGLVKQRQAKDGRTFVDVKKWLRNEE